LTSPDPLFELGKTIATPAALEATQAAGVNPSDLLKRHVTGDYGDICDEDDGLNDIAIKARDTNPLGLQSYRRADDLGHHRGRPLINLHAAAG
jgi:hypothetical protein